MEYRQYRGGGVKGIQTIKRGRGQWNTDNIEGEGSVEYRQYREGRGQWNTDNIEGEGSKEYRQ